MARIFWIGVSFVWLIYIHSQRVSSEGNKKFNISCPCHDDRWCKPINTQTKREVFAFSVKDDESHWKKYDWKRLTTLVMFGYVNQTLMCLAHSHGVRTVVLGEINKTIMLSPKLSKIWISRMVALVQENYLDGVNFDFENEVPKNDTLLINAYTTIVSETNKMMKSINPNYQISVDVAWKPNIDDRFYNYHDLANASDFLFVMAYDEQSQIFGECIAGPNSGINHAKQGLSTYIKDSSYKIDPKKLVLGVPWYGYIYQCLHILEHKCYIEKVPFRGVNCSDAAGKQYDYSFIYGLVKKMPDSYFWNSSSYTPFLQYMDATTSQSLQIHFDDPISLNLKYELAKQLGLYGVGMWNIDSLDYSTSNSAELMRKEMFEALDIFLLN